ncbi:MAG: ECF transporter S component, partial [Erysipelotrichaceae bacterium]|nr:ECF transporter S component [Erysipelotrichaceae bacterium]
MKSHNLSKKICLTAMFAALAYVLALIAHFLHLSIFPSVSFLTYDPKDIIICIGGLIMGPISALCISVVVSFIEMITISTTGFYGFVMNIFSTCAFVIPTTLIYKYKRNFKGAILSLVV